MQCSMNGVVIDEHHLFMAPIFSMTMHTKLIMRNFDDSSKDNQSYYLYPCEKTNSRGV